MLIESTYRSPWYLPGADLQTVVPHLRSIRDVTYKRQRVELNDGDFVDVDWSAVGRDRLAIIVHGLEGHACRPYMRSTVRAFNRSGWDALAWNMRACSGEVNRTAGFYHAGLSADLAAVFEHAMQVRAYEYIALVGFSLGGNLILKYLGEQGTRVPAELRAAATFSVPCDLADAVHAIHRRRNAFYLRRFIRHLRKKVRKKAAALPGIIDVEGLDDLRDLRAFDSRYTAPVHGYASADDYWASNSCVHFLSAIRIPALIVNAGNDTFLGSECYPLETVRPLDHVYMEVPKSGGHVGFPLKGGACWMEMRALQFFNEVLSD